MITAGTAIREALKIIGDAGGTVSGIVIALDRQEAVDPSDSRRSAAQNVAIEQAIPVVAVASLRDLLSMAGHSAILAAQHERLLAYRERYGSQQ